MGAKEVGGMGPSWGELKPGPQVGWWQEGEGHFVFMGRGIIAEGEGAGVWMV